MAPPSTPSAKSAPSDLPTHTFPTAAAFGAFLEHAHATAPGIYLKFAKKASGIPSITPAEAVETALCYGWIDGQRLAYDEQWYMNRYTPRRPRSLWSARNVAIAARLADEGRMRAAGLAAVDAAKADGRWERAYPGQASVEVPAAFAERLKGEREAGEFWEGLGASERYAVLWRLHTANPRNEQAVASKMLDMLAEGKVPGRSGAAGRESGSEVSKRPKKRVGAKKGAVAREGAVTKKGPVAQKEVVAQRRSTRRRHGDPEAVHDK